MAIRTLRRKVIIREYDFNKIKDEALGQHYDGYALYDRVSFEPLNEKNLEKLKLLDILKGKRNSALSTIDIDFVYPIRLLRDLKDYLYSEQYYRWDVTVDNEGYLCVQARKNTPKSRLGWGIFEKELESRL